MTDSLYHQFPTVEEKMSTSSNAKKRMTQTNPEGEDNRVSATDNKFTAVDDGPRAARDQHANAQPEGFGEEDESFKEESTDDERNDSSSDGKCGDAPTNDYASNRERTGELGAKYRNVRRRHVRGDAKTVRLGFNGDSVQDEAGLVCTLASVHYMVDGPVRSRTDSMTAMRFAFDTGAGYNIIRRKSLPPGWQDGTDDHTVPPRLNYANGYPLELGEVTWLNVRFGNTLFRVKFCIAERFAVDVIVGTSFLNRDVIAIRCGEH